jgi:hypothetical protein
LKVFSAGRTIIATSAALVLVAILLLLTHKGPSAHSANGADGDFAPPTQHAPGLARAPETSASPTANGSGLIAARISTDVSSRVIDLGTDSGAAGVAITAACAPGSVGEKRTSAQDGTISLPACAIALSSAAKEWTIIASSPLNLASPIYAFRALHVDGRVHAEGPGGDSVSPSTVTLEVIPLAPPTQGLGELPVDPWNLGWMRQHGLGDGVRDIAADQEGRFSIDVPHLRWLGIRARAPGWASSLHEFPVVAGDTTTVDLTLHVLPRISGRVLDADGMPIKKAIVRLQVMIRIRNELVDVSRLAAPPASFALIGRPDGWSVINYGLDATTSDDGRYVYDLPVSGDTYLTVYADGHDPARRQFGTPLANQDSTVTLTSASGPRRIPVRAGGAKGRTLAISDITDRDRQTIVMVGLDKDGALGSEYLEVGREYALSLLGATAGAGRTYGYLRWDGRPAIDIATLADGLESLDRQVGRK